MEKKDFVNAAIQLFNQKSVYFTLDELAKKLKMSKRTIYEVYGNKEAVIDMIVTTLVESIRSKEAKVIEDTLLDTVTKLKLVLCMYPSYDKVNYAYMSDIQEEYPRIYDKINESFDAGWEEKFAIYQEGVSEGRLKEINLQYFKVLLLGMFKEVLLMHQSNQEEAVEGCVDILLSGCLTDRP